MTTIWVFLLVWGVWIITPLLLDGVDAAYRLIVVRLARSARGRLHPVSDDRLPTVSIIVPCHNEAEVIDRCLTSIMAQDYPHDRLEVIVVDDGSSDATADHVEHHIRGTSRRTAKMPDGTVVINRNGMRIKGRPIMIGEFRGMLALIKNGHAGKANALNAGIAASTGDIIVNVDSDVVLEHACIRAIATAFARDRRLGAATGNVEIDWDVLEARDADGHLLLDEEGHILPRALGPMERFLAKSQFLEFIQSFSLGREAQSATGTIFTLAGACSAFRRDVLERSNRYSNVTVSEDTHMTLDLHRQAVTVGFIAEAVVYLEPVVEWDGVYAQRVRWTRGQLEVCGLNRDMVGTGSSGWLSRFALPKMLLSDHTLAFPRLLWTPLFLFFPFLGYPVSTVAAALGLTYAFYVVIEVVNVLMCYSIVDAHARTRIEQSAWMLLLMPAYRFIVFHFRFSGFLVTLKEPQRWTTQGPVDRTKRRLDTVRLRSLRYVSALMGMTQSLVRIAPHVVSYALVPVGSLIVWLTSLRRNG